MAAAVTVCCYCWLADYVRLLKYGDSLYRCKELKRAALVCGYHCPFYYCFLSRTCACLHHYLPAGGWLDIMLHTQAD